MALDRPELTALPRKDWHLSYRQGDDFIGAAMHVTSDTNHLYWTEVMLSDLPNDQISFEDLELIGTAIRVNIGAV